MICRDWHLDYFLATTHSADQLKTGFGEAKYTREQTKEFFVCLSFVG